jgi:hypothetical protein
MKCAVGHAWCLRVLRASSVCGLAHVADRLSICLCDWEAPMDWDCDTKRHAWLKASEALNSWRRNNVCSSACAYFLVGDTETITADLTRFSFKLFSMWSAYREINHPQTMSAQNSTSSSLTFWKLLCYCYRFWAIIDYTRKIRVPRFEGRQNPKTRVFKNRSGFANPIVSVLQ